MTKDHAARTLSIWIDRDPQAAYAFIADPRNLPAWASGLGHSVEERDGAWVVETPRGPARLRFTGPNPFGVLDHWVEPAPGVTVYVPMRVVPHETGSEVMLTLFRQPGMSEDAFRQDASWVERDLLTLKRVLEAGVTAARAP